MQRPRLMVLGALGVAAVAALVGWLLRSPASPIAGLAASSTEAAFLPDGSTALPARPGSPTGPGAPATSADEEAEIDHEQLKLAILHNPDPEERTDAILRLQADDDKDARDVLVAALGDHSVDVRRAAVEALRDYSQHLTVGEIAPALDDPDAEVRHGALVVLEDFDTAPDVLAAARPLLKDKDEDVREAAQRVVAQGH